MLIKRPHPLRRLEKNRDDGGYFGSFPEIVRLSFTTLENPVIRIFRWASINAVQCSCPDRNKEGQVERKITFYNLDVSFDVECDCFIFSSHIALYIPT